LWGLACPKSAGQPCRLETQRRVDVAALVQSQSGERISSSLGMPVFSLGPSNDWMPPTHIMDGNLFYPKSIDFNVSLHGEINFDQVCGTLA